MAVTISRKLVSISDTAEALAVSTRTVRRYITEGQLDAVRLGRKTLRIELDSIARLCSPTVLAVGRPSTVTSNTRP